jgi:hypothetical protein
MAGGRGGFVNGRRCLVGIVLVGLSVGPAVVGISSSAIADTRPVGYAGPAREITQTRFDANW